MNNDKRKEYFKEYYKKHKEDKYKERNKKWYQNHKEELKEYHREWQQQEENKQKMKEIRKRYHHKKGIFTKAELNEIRLAAIEYIENNIVATETETILLDILRGEDNE